MKEKLQKLYHKLAEKDLESMLIKMRYDEEKFYQIQQKRVANFAIMLLISGVLSVFSIVFTAFGLALAIYQWMSKFRYIQKSYKNFLFQQQLSFSKFTRMLIPYLYQENATLYNAFNRMLLRMEEGFVKDCLERLIIEMNDNPNSAVPFEHFAASASGTDEATLFMHTLYDYQQNSFDRSIIQELGRMASEELFKGVDEIIAFKLGRFNLFPTKLTMINLIIVMGYMIAVFVEMLKQLITGY
ncbi:hypothetical protein SAMN04488134_1206 [Amphibacillus marinus]|uniref:Uncharacterized protein n=1 Tax=Amphibacillus marinus TaxID=872970 RepID=A0A1H8TUG9_9BACI|nr:hypothetical protein [Amphibacillus marinus]SEO94485.1 hypothetical protein SAMN04488134_1206 [Amphibacillus marinus]